MRRSRRFLMAGVATGALFAAGCAEGPLPGAPTVAVPPAPQPTPTPTATPSATARYRVTFDASWSRSSHPQDFPSNPHFSPLVGGTHTAAVRFWAEGALASAGIRDMAERGRTQPLDQEIEAAIAAGTAQRLLIGGAVGTSPGSVVLEFEVSQAYPLVTLVTMIAPSPDWFVGVTALPLFENGQWAAERRVDLVPWDAGTDSGSSFSSPDRAAAPPEPISRILSAPLSPDGRVTPLGTFVSVRM